MIIDGIREYFSLCPLLSGAVINSDFLSEKPQSYAVYAENEEPVVKKYAAGDRLLCFLFSFRARMPLVMSPKENEKINMFFEELSDWLEGEASKGNLPRIGEDKEVQDLEIVRNGHLKNTNVADCVYEMKIKLIYYQRR